MSGGRNERTVLRYEADWAKVMAEYAKIGGNDSIFTLLLACEEIEPINLFREIEDRWLAKHIEMVQDGTTTTVRYKTAKRLVRYQEDGFVKYGVVNMKGGYFVDCRPLRELGQEKPRVRRPITQHPIVNRAIKNKIDIATIRVMRNLDMSQLVGFSKIMNSSKEKSQKHYFEEQDFLMKTLYPSVFGLEDKSVVIRRENGVEEHEVVIESPEVVIVDPDEEPVINRLRGKKPKRKINKKEQEFIDEITAEDEFEVDDELRGMIEAQVLSEKVVEQEVDQIRSANKEFKETGELLLDTIDDLESFEAYERKMKNDENKDQ